ncbi:MAG: hypothetical protein ACK4WD_11115 [Flavobacteriales bacterium]
MKKLEWALAIAVILCLCIKISGLPLGSFLTITSLSALSMFYFMSGYFIINNLTPDFGVRNPTNPSFFETMLGIATGVFIAGGVIGLMFILQSWPGGWFFLIMGNSGLLLTSLISFYRFRDYRAHPTKAVLWRFVLYGSGTLLFALGSVYM